MKYLKSFENRSIKNIKKGDLVRFKSSKSYGDNIFIVDATNTSKYGNETLLYPYHEYLKYMNNEITILDGIGWILNDKLEKLSEEEISAIKYNL